MLKVAVLVSGGGTNLQAILDAVDSGKITNTEIRVVISNNEGAYALERAKNYGTEALLLSPKSFETREEFNQKLLEALKERDIDLVVLAGYPHPPACRQFCCSASVPTVPAECVPCESSEKSWMFFASFSRTHDPTPST